MNFTIEWIAWWVLPTLLLVAFYLPKWWRFWKGSKR